MYVNNTNILLIIYNVYNYDYSFGENKNRNKRTLIVKLKETHNFSKYIVWCANKYIKKKVKYLHKYYLFLYQKLCEHSNLAFLTVKDSQYLIVVHIFAC